MCLKYNRLKSLLHNPFLRRTKRGAEVIIVDEAKVPEQKYVVKIERKKERKRPFLSIFDIRRNYTDRAAQYTH